MAVGAHASDGRSDDLLLHHAQERLGHDRRGRVGTHPAGVLAEVVVEDAFVVLGRSEEDVSGAVGEGEDGGLLPFEVLFDDDAVPGGAERLAAHHHLDDVGRSFNGVI